MSVIRRLLTVWNHQYVNQLMGRAERILPSSFRSLGPIATTIKSLLEAVATVQRTGDSSSLREHPAVVVMTDAIIKVFAGSWHFVIVIAYIYFFMVIIFSLATPSTDKYLSDRIFVRLNSISSGFRFSTRQSQSDDVLKQKEGSRTSSA